VQCFERGPQRGVISSGDTGGGMVGHGDQPKVGRPAGGLFSTSRATATSMSARLMGGAQGQHLKLTPRISFHVGILLRRGVAMATHPYRCSPRSENDLCAPTRASGT